MHILQQFHLPIEVNEEGFVRGLHEHLIEKTAAGVAFGVKRLALIGTGVDEQADSKRLIRLLRKKRILSGCAIFPQREIVFGEIVHDLAMFVAHGDRQRDHGRLCSDSGSAILSLRRRRRLARYRKNDQDDYSMND